MNIFLDIGHAYNTGARGCGLEEHGLAVRIALNLAEKLRACGHRVSVVDFPKLTNGQDLRATIEAANSVNFDFGLSLHCDSSSNAEARGAHVCYNRTYTKDGMPLDSPVGKILAGFIADELCPVMPGRAERIVARPDRKKKLTSLAILSQTRHPWVLIECLFITNEKDTADIDGKIELIAGAIARGVENFIESLPK